MESFQLAVAQGADLVEVDLQLSRDGFLVAFHDWDLQRMAGTAGVVEELTREELRRIPLTWHPTGGSRPAQIAGLKEVLERLPAEIPLNLELKRRWADPQVLVAALGCALADRSQVLVSSFDWALLAEVRRQLPHQPLAPLAKRGPRELLRTAAELDAFSVHCHRRLGRRRLIRAAKKSGRPTLVYTVNEVNEARKLLRRGTAGLFTDFPGRLRRGLEESS